MNYKKNWKSILIIILAKLVVTIPTAAISTMIWAAVLTLLGWHGDLVLLYIISLVYFTGDIDSFVRDQLQDEFNITHKNTGQITNATPTTKE